MQLSHVYNMDREIEEISDKMGNYPVVGDIFGSCNSVEIINR